MTHEVAYSGLLQEHRRALHARIVEASEAGTGDRVVEPVERLAYHAVRGEVWDKALTYCRQAGDKTMAQSAYHEAVGYFEQALAVLPRLPEQRARHEQAIDLRLALRSALHPAGNSERILTVLREAETLAEALDDPRRLGQVALFLSIHFCLRGVHEQASAAAQRALTLALASGDGILHALGHFVLGMDYAYQGDFRRAIDCHAQTVATLNGGQRYERFGVPALPAVNARAFLAWCHAELGTFATGRALGDEGLRIAAAVAHPLSCMIASWGMGLLSLRQGAVSQALPLLERAMGLCRDLDLPLFFPRQAAALGTAYTLAGRVADAVPLLMQAVASATPSERVDFETLCHLALGEAQLLAGRLEEAYPLAAWTLAHAREHQERGNEAYALRLLGAMAAQRTPPAVDEAAAHYQQALALAEALGMRPLQAHCHRGLGTLYAKRGQREQARTALSTARELYHAMDMTFWLPETASALMQVEGQ